MSEENYLFWNNETSSLLNTLVKNAQEFMTLAFNPSPGLRHVMQLATSYQRVMAEGFNQLLLQPQEIVRCNLEFSTHYFNWYYALLNVSAKTDELVTTSDKRFKHRDWETPPFHYVKLVYLLTCEYWQSLTKSLELSDPLSTQQFKFGLDLMLQAMSPTHFVVSNPEILTLTLEKKGLNLIQGMQQLLADVNLWQGYLNLKKTPLDAFTVGTNIASTPGCVIYQNELMQLIQYAPSTKKVYQHPILIVTSWINKYYVLDLRTNNSLVRWLVELGFTVFVISWVNPTSALAHKGFADYVLDGPVAALMAIEKATGEKKVNTLGFCLGGTLLASANAYLAKTDPERVMSGTYLATLLDFSNAGAIVNFSAEEQLQLFEQFMQEIGYWSGFKMVTAFNLMRADEFIFPYAINSYLRGRAPMKLDSLFWAQDLTHSPTALYTFYLRNLLQRNELIEAGKVVIDGHAIDLKQIKMPSYFIAMNDDHLCPWQSSYQGAYAIAGPKQFILVDAGHVEGVINPPSRNKHRYWVNNIAGEDPNTWLATAAEIKGSWWEQWGEWLQQFGGKWCDAREPGKGGLPRLEPAPGSYAKERVT